MKNSGKILLGFGAGASIGILLGILFAPEKGSETRKKISHQANRLSDRIQNIKKKVTGNSTGHEDGRSMGVENEINEYVC